MGDGFGMGRKNALFKNVIIFMIAGLASFLISYYMFRQGDNLPERFNIIKYLLFVFGFVCFYIVFNNYKKLKKDDLWNFNPKNFMGLGIFIFIIGMIYKSMLNTMGGNNIYYSYMVIGLGGIIFVLGLLSLLGRK